MTANATTLTPTEIANMNREQGIAQIKATLTQDEILRFGYVPFVIARLVWDYADTILDICIQMRLQETKRLSRAVRQLKDDYDRNRIPYIDKTHEDNESRNMLIIEEAIEEHTDLFFLNLRCAVEREYPELTPEYRQLIYAVYQCRAMLSVCLRYAEVQRAHVAKRMGWVLNSMLPPQVKALEPLIIAFAGDKTLGADWDKTETTFVNTFVTQIGLLRLSEKEDNV